MNVLSVASGLALCAAALLAGCTGPGPPAVSDCDDLTRDTLTLSDAANPVAVWTTNHGCIVAEMFLETTPITAGNFLNLSRDGFYDGTRFHRVISGFMIQDGDPQSKDPDQRNRWGTGGPGYTIQDEFPCNDGTTSHTHRQVAGGDPCRDNGGLRHAHGGPGVLSMANSGPNSGGSQYFITVEATPHLDGGHAIFGQVVEGMDVVMEISNVATDGNPPQGANRPLEDVLIHKIVVLDP